MSELLAFRLQIARVFLVLRLFQRHPIADAQAVALEANHLARVVRDRPDRFEAEVEQDLRTDAVVAQVRLEAETFIRLDRVRAFILQLVRLELVQQADAAPLLIEIYDDAAPFL